MSDSVPLWLVRRAVAGDFGVAAAIPAAEAGAEAGIQVEGEVGIPRAVGVAEAEAILLAVEVVVILPEVAVAVAIPPPLVQVLPAVVAGPAAL